MWFRIFRFALVVVVNAIAAWKFTKNSKIEWKKMWKKNWVWVKWNEYKCMATMERIHSTMHMYSMVSARYLNNCFSSVRVWFVLQTTKAFFYIKRIHFARESGKARQPRSRFSTKTLTQYCFFIIHSASILVCMCAATGATKNKA